MQIEKHFTLLYTQPKRDGKSFIFAVCRKRHALPVDYFPVGFYCSILPLDLLPANVGSGVFLAGAVYFVLLLVRVLSCFKYPYANSENFYDDDLTKRQQHCR